MVCSLRDSDRPNIHFHMSNSPDYQIREDNHIHQFLSGIELMDPRCCPDSMHRVYNRLREHLPSHRNFVDKLYMCDLLQSYDTDTVQYIYHTKSSLY